MEAVFIIGVLLFAAVTTVVIKRKSSNKAKKLSIAYQAGDERAFHIKGDEDSFIISKNNQYDFLVERGRIVASRDRNRSKKFVYYEGE